MPLGERALVLNDSAPLLTTALQGPMTDPLLPRSEREQTDESLRLERDRADRALDDEVSEADETADAVISRARARADAVLAAARTKTDQTSIGDQPTDALKTSRAMEDHILQRERVTADHVLHRERSEHVTLLSEERQATDHDLSHERARSDKALAMRDDFMGIVSHDLLNLLNAMVGISSLIEKEVAQEHHVERVVAHARRVQRSGPGCADSSETSLTSRALKRVCSQWRVRLATPQTW